MFRPALARRVPAQCAAYRTPNSAPTAARPHPRPPPHARTPPRPGPRRRRGPGLAADRRGVQSASEIQQRQARLAAGARLSPPAPRLHRLGGGTVEVVNWGRSTPNEVITLNALRILRTGPASKTPSSQTSRPSSISVPRTAARSGHATTGTSTPAGILDHRRAEPARRTTHSMPRCRSVGAPRSGCSVSPCLAASTIRTKHVFGRESRGGEEPDL